MRSDQLIQRFAQRSLDASTNPVVRWRGGQLRAALSLSLSLSLSFLRETESSQLQRNLRVLAGRCVVGEYKAFDDHELVGRLAGGDVRALEVLIERHVHLVEASLAAELQDPWRAQEAVAYACEECWLHRDRVGRVTSFSSWLYRSARNVALNMKRSEDRDRFRAERFVSTSRRPATPAEELERTELHHGLLAALGELSPRRQLAVIFVDLEGLPYAEAGLVMDAPLNTVKAHLHAGRALLREKLGAAWREYREGPLRVSSCH